MKISVVVPVYNEGAAVRFAYDGIAQTFRDKLSDHEYEIIFVDDGSNDDSFEHLTRLAHEFPEVLVLKFSQNAGSHMAIRAGLEHASGRVAVFLACDLQDPPELIPEMLKALRPPVQIVWAVRNTRQDTWQSQLFSRVFFALARALVTDNLPPSGASMFMLGTEALRSIPLYQERNLTLEGLFATMRLTHAQIPYERRMRRFGTSKWTLAKKLKLFADFFVGYSYVPIRMMSYAGIMVATLGFLYALIVLLNWSILGKPVEGWTSLMLVVLVMGGFQMTMLGIIGEYVWRDLDETRKRPRYIIQTALNTPAAAGPAKLGEKDAAARSVERPSPAPVLNLVGAESAVSRN